MIRLGYIGLSVLMAFVPLTFYWAMNRPGSQVAQTSRYYRTHPHHGGTYIYYGGGHGGWLGNTYTYGRGGYVDRDVDRYDRLGGASAHRGGGPSAGGK